MRTSPPTSAPSWRAPSAFVRSVRPMQNRSGRSQNVSPPSIVPGASIRPTVGIPAARVQASMAAGSVARFGLPGRSGIAPRSVTSSGSNVYTRSGDVELDVEHVDARPERRQRLDERVVLAACELEVDRVEEAVGRIVEGGAERRPRPLDEDVEQRRGHALGAEPAIGGQHRRSG